MKHGVWDNRAAVIESTITVGSNPVLELQLKILGPATAPDDERVAFDERTITSSVRGGLSGLSGGQGNVYVPGSDSTLYAFGFEIEK